MNGTEEEFVPEEEAEEGPAALKKLREKIKKAVEEKQEYLDGWQRSRAEFANFKRDELARASEQELRLKAEFVETLLPALDTFEMALQHAPTNELQVVRRQLLGALARLGVEQIGLEDGKDTPIGKPFNPSEQEALQEIEGPAEFEHAVVKVFRSGYKVGSRVIRPVQVGIGVPKK